MTKQKKKPEKEQEQEEKPERGLTEQSMGQRTDKISLINSKEFNFKIYIKLHVFKERLQFKPVIGSTGLITFIVFTSIPYATDKLSLTRQVNCH